MFLIDNNGIIESINNKFSNFLPKKEIQHNNFDQSNLCEISSYFGEDYDHFISEDVKRYHLVNHSFWHHNLDNDNVRQSFNRRIERFIKLLQTSEEEIIFFRLIISKNIMEEVNERDNFFKSLNSLNSNLNSNMKIIFMSISNHDDNGKKYINYKFIDDKTALIISPKFSNNKEKNILEGVKNIVIMIKNHGFFYKDILFDTDTEKITETCFEKYDCNYMDNPNYMDINIH